MSNDKNITPRSLRWFWCSVNMTLTLSTDTICFIAIQGSLPLLKPFSVTAYYSAKLHNIIMHWLSVLHWKYSREHSIYNCLGTASTKSDLEVSSEGGIFSPFSFYSIAVSHTWAGRGNGFALLLQESLGGWAEFRCGCWVNLATSIKTCQRQEDKKWGFFFNAY